MSGYNCAKILAKKNQRIKGDRSMLEDVIAVLNGSPQMDPATYQYYNKLLNQRTIIFNQEVDEEIVERVAIPLLDFEKDSSNDPVTLIIATVGGSISDGFILCNIIDNYSKPLDIIVLGYAASMGTIILAAGAHNPNVTRKCYPFTYALLHAGSTAFSGEALSVQDTLEFNKRIDEKVKQFITTHTNVSEKDYEEHERKQWFLDAEDMLKYGFVDEIIGKEEDELSGDTK